MLSRFLKLLQGKDDKVADATDPRGDETPLFAVVEKLYETEPPAQWEDIIAEINAFYEDGRDDIFFSIADQSLTRAIGDNIEAHLTTLTSLSEKGEVDETLFRFELVEPIVDVANSILFNLERLYNVDLTRAGRVLRDPDSRDSVTKLVKEKISRYLKLFAARNVDVAEIYGRTTQLSAGEAYEEQVGKIFESEGWTVVRTPVSGDQGADLLCVKSDSKLVVQCKFYTGNVGNAAVQEVHAAKGFYDADYGAVVSNAGFTRSAIALAEKLGVLLVPDDMLEQFARGQVH